MFVRLGEPRIIHVLLLGQVQLGVLHAGPLVHVLCLVQLRLCVAQAGLVHARGHVPQFSRSWVGPTVYNSVSDYVRACSEVIRLLRMSVQSLQLVYSRHFGYVREHVWQAPCRCRGSWAQGSWLSPPRPSGPCRGPCHREWSSESLCKSWAIAHEWLGRNCYRYFWRPGSRVNPSQAGLHDGDALGDEQGDPRYVVLSDCEFPYGSR